MEGPPELELPVPAQVWVADIPSSLERGNLAGPPPDIFTISRRGIGRRISRLEPLYLGEGLLPTSELAQAEHDPLEIFILAPSRLRGRLLAQPPAVPGQGAFEVALQVEGAAGVKGGLRAGDGICRQPLEKVLGLAGTVCGDQRLGFHSRDPLDQIGI